ncbi:DNA mismatch repair protein mutS [Desulforamulus hydrothermalis Lam5 = DSM 18033]|uniref:DNA mismatch repair protein MutS n=1 Tax=Desulforamulus hydrothermalis Lam5 = DSM 18033 TaxID=1121428 RepID=K8ELJ1_9FIRM|nr:DNA mismatch repair protein mutS [Desulforamulus hydrothermalis Lam5 = DSM 18033]SHH32436.1 DNA mismatch repair protein MutS [Desulforamulus hydrothermalis Lam5 = DSM 18033]
MALTPMMQQYLEIKKQFPDAILFFRLGDFYEMFFEDAKLAAKELEITLTGRDAGEPERVPMCGVPFHAADNYIGKLIDKGYKVAICEQVEDPRTARGIVKREVVRIITPGTLIDGSMLSEKDNNYLVALCQAKQDLYGMAVTDLSTGLFQVTELSGSGAGDILLDEIVRLSPREVLLDQDMMKDARVAALLQGLPSTTLTPFRLNLDQAGCRQILQNHFGSDKLANYNEKQALCLAAAGLLSYLTETQRRKLYHITEITCYSPRAYMMLDGIARRNLEITKSLRDGGTKGTLLGVLDKTRTAMGGRLLKSWLEQPLINLSDIQARLDAVEELVHALLLREELAGALKQIYDLERLTARAAYGTANGRDLTALLGSLEKLPSLYQALQQSRSSLLRSISRQFDTLDDLRDLLSASLADNPPASLRDGGLIKDGYHPEVDRLRAAARDGKAWLAGLEAREKEKTGIKNLKVGFNKVFGYYLEVTKANLHAVPDYYQRRQTLANAERYITPELKEYESMILGAADRLVELEYDLFTEIRGRVADQVQRIQKTAALIAQIDVLVSLAEVATARGYVKPRLSDEGVIEITEGRHPVVEMTLGPGRFVPNDTCLDTANRRLCLITGPNMGGKSTYQRQVALIVLLAQVGSFVPASMAKIGIVDRIFARVGASDDLSSGQSTFMVEMFETRQILDNATARSLVIIDELGRGTSNLEGMAIAQAVIEYLHDVVGCRTLFSTHYHELAELEGLLPGLKNYATAVQEQGDQVVFLRKVVRDKASKSYGVHCARLAGLPGHVIERAAELVQQLEYRQRAAQEVVAGKNQVAVSGQEQAPALFTTEQDWLRQEILALDLTNMTPLQCLNYLSGLQSKLRNNQ